MLEPQSAPQLRRARRNLAAARVDVGRVLVVDDSPVFRQIAHSVLSATTRLRPFGEAGSSPGTVVVLMSADSDALEEADRSAPAVAVLDKPTCSRRRSTRSGCSTGPTAATRGLPASPPGGGPPAFRLSHGDGD
jgi:DNA-binding NarL/FixJ family response regulator